MATLLLFLELAVVVAMIYLGAKVGSIGLGHDFVNYAKLEAYYDFGGIRLEDDVLITPDGARRLGSRRLPIAPDEVEAVMK